MIFNPKTHRLSQASAHRAMKTSVELHDIFKSKVTENYQDYKKSLNISSSLIDT